MFLCRILLLFQEHCINLVHHKPVWSFRFIIFYSFQQGLARGKKFKVFAKRSICEKLAEMLRVTLLGPDYDEVLSIESKLNLPSNLDKKKIKQIIAETRFLAPKDKNGRDYELEEMVELIPLEIGEKKVIYDAYEKYPEITINRADEDEFVLKCDRTIKCTLSITKPQSPVYPIKGEKISESEINSKSIFTVRCLGASEGFDPTQPANGFLLHFNRKWILWDCPAFLHKHLEKIGLQLEKIDGIFVSHVHEDHLDIMESVGSGKKTDIYTSPEIFHCMILKLMTILDCSYDEALSHYNFHPVYVNQPFDLFGSTVEVFLFQPCYSRFRVKTLSIEQE